MNVTDVRQTTDGQAIAYSEFTFANKKKFKISLDF